MIIYSYDSIREFGSKSFGLCNDGISGHYKIINYRKSPFLIMRNFQVSDSEKVSRLVLVDSFCAIQYAEYLREVIYSSYLRDSISNEDIWFRRGFFKPDNFDISRKIARVRYIKHQYLTQVIKDLRNIRIYRANDGRLSSLSGIGSYMMDELPLNQCTARQMSYIKGIEELSRN